MHYIDLFSDEPPCELELLFVIVAVRREVAQKLLFVGGGNYRGEYLRSSGVGVFLRHKALRAFKQADGGGVGQFMVKRVHKNGVSPAFYVEGYGEEVLLEKVLGLPQVHLEGAAKVVIIPPISDAGDSAAHPFQHGTGAWDTEQIFIAALDLGEHGVLIGGGARRTQLGKSGGKPLEENGPRLQRHSAFNSRGNILSAFSLSRFAKAGSIVYKFGIFAAVSPGGELFHKH